MSFLSRLSRAAPEAELDRIMRNLDRVFNARKGFGSVVEEFGLGDYEASWNTPAILEVLENEILAAVRRYEPGIEDPAVELAGRDHVLWVRFVLSGRVAGQAQRFHIDIDSKYRNVKISLPRGSRRKQGEE